MRFLHAAIHRQPYRQLIAELGANAPLEPFVIACPQCGDEPPDFPKWILGGGALPAVLDLGRLGKYTWYRRPASACAFPGSNCGLTGVAPLMFDDNFQPKPAYNAVAALLAGG